MIQRCIISGYPIIQKLPENDFVEAMNLCDNNIVYIRFKPVLLDRSHIEYFYHQLESISKQIKYSFIMDFRQTPAIQPDALAHLWNKEHHDKYIYAVFIVDRKYSGFGEIIYYSGSFMHDFNPYSMKFHILDTQENVLLQAETWLQNHYDPILINKLLYLNDINLKILAGILNQKSSSEISKLSGIPFSTVSKKKGNFTMHILGEDNLLKISYHLSYIPHIREKMDRFDKLFRKKHNQNRFFNTNS